MTEPACRLRLRLRLEAEGRPGLFELLDAASGASLGGRYTIEGPFDAGRRSWLFSALDRASGERVLVKQAGFDYRRLVRYGRADAEAMRAPLRAEHAALAACTTGHLPRPLALFTAPSPLPAAADFRNFADELFLVEELVDAPTLERAAAARWPALEAPAREHEAKRVACELKWFWEGMRKVGLHYGDLSARNVLVASGGATRVVDAGCVVPAAARVVLREFTPAFLTPRLYAAALAGEPVPGDLSSVLPAVAKIVHFALTLAQPLNGAPPDLEAPALAAYSPACRRALASMAEVDGDGERLERALADLAAWVGW